MRVVMMALLLVACEHDRSVRGRDPAGSLARGPIDGIDRGPVAPLARPTARGGGPRSAHDRVVAARCRVLAMCGAEGGDACTTRAVAELDLPCEIDDARADTCIDAIDARGCALTLPDECAAAVLCAK